MRALHLAQPLALTAAETRHIWHRSSSASNLPGTTLLGSHSLHAVDAPLSKQKMATSAELYASAQILGTECADANMAFLKCKAEAQHPRHCLEAGTAVTSCAVRKSTSELGYPENYCVDLRDLVNLHAIELPQLRGHTSSRRWHRISAPSSRCSYGDDAGSMTWGVRNLISTQVLRRRPHRFSQSEEWRGIRGIPRLPCGHEQRV